MAKRQLRFWLSTAILGLLVACGGGGGGDRATGVEPGPEAPGGSVPPPAPVLPGPVGYADAEEIFAFILSASIPADGQPMVDFQVTDGNNTAILDLEAGNIRLIISKLQASSLGNLTGEWQSYVNQIRDSSASPLGSVLQGTTESNGDFTNNSDGTYRYRFSTNVTDLPADIQAQANAEGLNVDYEPDRTHRVAMQFSGGPNPANPVYDFVPATGASAGIFNMNISATNNCNRCHDPLAFHGSGRFEVNYCVTCHNPGTSSASGGYTVSFKNLVHRIHMGANLPSVIAGGDYRFGDVIFPQDIRNCQNCHVGTGTTNGFYDEVLLTNQGDNWNEFPTRNACGSCHDDVNFDTHRGGQPDDSRCASCHSVGGRAGSPEESHEMLVRDEGAKFLAEVLSVVNGGPGEFPSVQIKVSNPDTGTAYDILNDAPFTNAGASLNVKLAWATTDYHNTGNGADNASAISQSALSTATDNGDGSFQVVYLDAIPSGGLATGSGAAVIDGHPAVVLEGDVDPTNIFITDAVGYFSIDEASGTATPRRQSVATEQCQACHQNLVLHGSNRADNVNSCVSCHNPRNTDRGVREIAANPPTDGKDEESIDFKTMVHAIHASAMRENPLQIVGFGGFSTNVYDEEHVQYPGARATSSRVSTSLLKS